MKGLTARKNVKKEPIRTLKEKRVAKRTRRALQQEDH